MEKAQFNWSALNSLIPILIIGLLCLSMLPKAVVSQSEIELEDYKTKAQPELGDMEVKDVTAFDEVYAWVLNTFGIETPDPVDIKRSIMGQDLNIDTPFLIDYPVKENQSIIKTREVLVENCDSYTEILNATGVDNFTVDDIQYQTIYLDCHNQEEYSEIEEVVIDERQVIVYPTEVIDIQHSEFCYEIKDAFICENQWRCDMKQGLEAGCEARFIKKTAPEAEAELDIKMLSPIKTRKEVLIDAEIEAEKVRLLEELELTEPLEELESI